MKGEENRKAKCDNDKKGKGEEHRNYSTHNAMKCN